jgi:hypothetical protein
MPAAWPFTRTSAEDTTYPDRGDATAGLSGVSITVLRYQRRPNSTQRTALTSRPPRPAQSREIGSRPRRCRRAAAARSVPPPSRGSPAGQLGTPASCQPRAADARSLTHACTLPVAGTVTHAGRARGSDTSQPAARFAGGCQRKHGIVVAACSGPPAVTRGARLRAQPIRSWRPAVFAHRLSGNHRHRLSAVSEISRLLTTK